MHATHNTVIQAILTPLTMDTGHTKWFIDEFGCALAVVAVLVAFLVWRRRADVERPTSALGADYVLPAPQQPRSRIVESGA